jgi:5-methylcytosine-specific restriction endonuclease McrA
LPVPQPKPSAKIRDRIADKARLEKLDRDFKAQVWKRDGSKCQDCGKAVQRTLTASGAQGHVHHLRGRNVAPEARYDPAGAILLCAVCHLKRHGQ